MVGRCLRIDGHPADRILRSAAALGVMRMIMCVMFGVRHRDAPD